MKIKILEDKNEFSLYVDLLVLLFFFACSVAIVNPIGNFPLNDDWSFAQTVKNLVERGGYSPTGWVAMPLATNVVWGAVFCLPTGFSFSALRLSTLAMSLTGMLGTYWLAKDLKMSRLFCIVAALTLGFNPIYHALSNTFMTDVLFTALQTLAALFFLRCLKDDSNWSLCIGISIAVAATLSRQLGIAVPVAFTIAYFFRNGITGRNVWRGLAPLLVNIGALALFQYWLSSTGRLSDLYEQQNSNFFSVLQNPKQLLISEAMNAYVALLYLGLFSLPILLMVFPAMWEANIQKKINIWWSIVIFGCITFLFSQYVADPLLPMFGNVLNEFGIGPLTLRDTYIMGLPQSPGLPHEFWLLMTWLSMFGALLITLTLIFFVKKMIAELRAGKMTVEGISSLFLLLSAIAYLFPILTSTVADRYLVPVIPLLMLGIMSLFTGASILNGRFFKYAGFMFVIAFSVFSICASRDYLTWNRARWQALNNLTEVEHVSAEDIDGGFEFNGWYFYDPAYVRDSNKSWWWVQSDIYLIGFQNVLGYTTVKEYPYSHWLPPYIGKIVVQKRLGY